MARHVVRKSNSKLAGKWAQNKSSVASHRLKCDAEVTKGRTHHLIYKWLKQRAYTGCTLGPLTPSVSVSTPKYDST